MPPELKIQLLRYVVTVVEEGGFHAAARRLHRTQPALSMAIRDLEQKLGQPLFERTGKGAMTPFGQYCLPRFRDLINQHDRLARDIMAHSEGRHGHVNLATVPSVASRIMPALLAGFTTRNPGPDISLHDENAEFVCRMVAQGEVDFGITSLWQSDDRLDYQHLFEDKIGVVVRNDHRFAGHTELRWQDLIGERIIRNGTSRVLQNSSAASLIDNSAFFISNMISLIAMLEAGAGITTLPRLAFPEGPTNLCFIPLHEPRLVRGIGLVTLAGRTLSPAAQAMADYILAELRQPA
ncbi:MAG: LysR family transcriptional regulator [Marinobacter sp.]|nr:LysR family transcriptional regulator [Marinobacter sp.]